MVYEYLQKGTLVAILSNEEKAAVLGWGKRVNIIKGVAYGLSCMRPDCSPPIVHKDISSKNVLLDEEFEAHISNFRTAKLRRLDSSNWTQVLGTYEYIAPGNLAHIRLFEYVV